MSGPGRFGQWSRRAATHYSRRNRERKWELFGDTFPPRAEWRVLDVGFAPGHNPSPNENWFERHYPHTDRITALTVAEVGDAAERYPGVEIVRYDGDVIPFEDGAFDLVWSNAVVEHVGTFDAQVRFLRELDRVAHRHFVTTPNRWFPVETHTKLPLVHYLPKDTFDRVANRAGKGWATGDYMHLLGRGDFERALRSAGVQGARLVANRYFGIPVDFVAIW